ncbi:MAG: glycosyltransferase [Luteolibacter sp.]
MSARPRLLIVTAAFGEGHNSAARNLSLALEAAGAETRVSDPCSQSSPLGTELVSKGYRYVTTHFPSVWARIYRSTDQYDFSQPSPPVLDIPERFLDRLIEEYRPDAVISTFPLYPYFLARTMEETGKKFPVFTVVTDSIEINASWLKAPTDFWLVTDSRTRELMAGKGLDAEKIIDLGFPVHPDFSKLTPVSPEDACEPFRVLYFPTRNSSCIRHHGKAALETSPDVQLTIVMGKNVRSLHTRAKELQKTYPGRVKLIGWTRKVPHLLNSHHLVIGKAGGATVHEAIAARCPMLIHHLVPGQEEGNLRLLEAIGAGCLCETGEALAEKIRDLLADHATKWRAMKQALIRHDRNSGALTSARFILDHVSETQDLKTQDAR